MDEGEGKLHLIGSRKFGMESKSGKTKQTWKLMAERDRAPAWEGSLVRWGRAKRG